jgi:hypothetical protein
VGLGAEDGGEWVGAVAELEAAEHGDVEAGESVGSS